MILMRKVISIRTQPSVLGVLWNPLPHGLSGACVELHKAREERGPEGQGGRVRVEERRAKEFQGAKPGKAQVILMNKD